MSTTRYKIRLWEYDGEASAANAVTFDSFDEAQARLRVSFMPSAIVSAATHGGKTAVRVYGKY